ncbi:hypothetical protein G9A89_007472 [Geosiphon pyriformis]|nr:hypothetical protein G9A89_007472 [Geosiphon pyriformis]
MSESIQPRSQKRPSQRSPIRQYIKADENTPQRSQKNTSQRSPLRQYLRAPLSDITRSERSRLFNDEIETGSSKFNSIRNRLFSDELEPDFTPPPCKRAKICLGTENTANFFEKKYSQAGRANAKPGHEFENKIWRIQHNKLGPFHILWRRELWGTTHGGSLLSGKTWKASTRFMMKDFISTENDVYRFYGENRYVAPFACTFTHSVKDGSLLAVADEEGTISLIDSRWDNRIEMEQSRTRFNAHNNAIFDIQWSLDDRTLATASGDQSARLWDVETKECTAIFQGHTCSIKSIAAHPESPFIWATASRDGNIRIWDSRKNPLKTVDGELHLNSTLTISSPHSPMTSSKKNRLSDPNPIRSTPTNSVTGVQFLKHANHLATSGAVDGIIKCWDISGTSRNKLLETSISCSTAKRPHGISTLALDNSGQRLFANSTDNYIYVYDATKLGAPLARFTHPTYRCSSFYVRIAISPDDRYLVSGSSDKALYIWEIDAPEQPPIILYGHEQEVTSIAWGSKGFDTIASCSDDATLRIWHRRGYEKEDE